MTGFGGVLTQLHTVNNAILIIPAIRII